MKSAEPETTRIDVPVDGGELAAFVDGAGLDSGAPVVLMAHGITANHVAWTTVTRLLGRTATVVAPDLRGRGRSNVVREPFGIRSHAADLLAVLDHLGAERAVVVGHSMGGFVAARLAADHSDRVRGVVLVDGGVALAAPPGLDVDAVLDAVLGPAIARLSMTFADRDEYHEFWRQHPAFEGAWTADVEAYVDWDLVPDDRDGEARWRSSVSDEAVRADGAEVVVDRTAATTANELTVRTTLLRAPDGMFGTPPPLIDPAVAAAWAEGDAARRQVAEIAGANHYTILFAAGADRVAETIGRYLPEG